MNKKYLNSTLIVLLVIIWGAVFYKYFGDNKRSSESVDTINPLAFNEQHYLVIKDTFLLKLTDRDPFKVSRDIKKKSIKPSAKKNKKVVKPVIKKNMVWPTITYHGFVKGESRNTRLILLKIANKLYRKREKETVSDIILEKAYKDSLIVSLNNNSKTIIKTR
ncbi:hypothetical protein Q4Q35_04190 [Flavivirga aquimarina]|uniref:Uncharacterized protein n=1 Tax=Flavivirga aquimarina TaxID=2027862 RepID=A0ABT8W791_9FLAO|nr:hypothetical protein [Flavivirga aquimarina]MDO5968999.1 hypothetical protein [Flavivirga aquimarina]